MEKFNHFSKFTRNQSLNQSKKMLLKAALNISPDSCFPTTFTDWFKAVSLSLCMCVLFCCCETVQDDASTPKLYEGQSGCYEKCSPPGLSLKLLTVFSIRIFYKYLMWSRRFFALRTLNSTINRQRASDNNRTQ